MFRGFVMTIKVAFLFCINNKIEGRKNGDVKNVTFSYVRFDKQQKKIQYLVLVLVLDVLVAVGLIRGIFNKY